MLEWESARFDSAVSDVFGFHALQLGLPELDTLQANRMPHRWLGCDVGPNHWPAAVDTRPRQWLLTESMALPFAEASLDLVTLPHCLELSPDPHGSLREVARVLVPEGRVVITGFNPTSLWGVRNDRAVLPSVRDWIGYWRLRDWLQLLSFDVEISTFGCCRPYAKRQPWLDRWAWMDRAGARWWPIFGAVYCIVAVKRVRGMRLMEPVWKLNKARQAQTVTTASQRMK